MSWTTYEADFMWVGSPRRKKSKNVKIISLAPFFTGVIMEKPKIFDILK
jgi:hypothetical protein